VDLFGAKMRRQRHNSLSALHGRPPATERRHTGITVKKTPTEAVGGPKSDANAPKHQPAGKSWPPRAVETDGPRQGCRTRPAVLVICSTGARRVLLWTAKNLRFQATPSLAARCGKLICLDASIMRSFIALLQS
jgi:hypothetical protein